jgi:hypothetical protein
MTEHTVTEQKAFLIFERCDMALKLWEFVAPAIPAPPKETLVYWLSKYTNGQFDDLKRCINEMEVERHELSQGKP